VLGLVTAEVAAALDPDLLPLAVALRGRLGDNEVHIVSWDDSAVDWSAFDAVIIRSTWDYTDRLDEFLAWVDRAAAVTTLVNDADVVRWSSDKRYLADLAREGIRITPTIFVAPGDPAPQVRGVHVVKPTVGAGSSGARRCDPHEVADHVAVLHAEGRTAMVQPYLDLLDDRGETCHCFVLDADGVTLELSHAFRKGAILMTTDVELEGDLFATEDISPRVPSAAELKLATDALSTDVVRNLGDVFFARVDVAPFQDESGRETFIVMELELIEPSFYYATNEAAVALFADRLVGWLRARGLDSRIAGS
jgi:hypothetical protein